MANKMSIEVPEYEAKAGYMANMFNSRMQLRQILTIPEFTQDPMRVYYTIKIIIQDEIRDRNLRKETISNLDKNIKEKIEEYKNSYKERSDDPRVKEHDIEKKSSQIILDEAINSLGECTNYNDKFLAIATENKIQITKLECINCKYRIGEIQPEDEDDENTVEELYGET